MDADLSLHPFLFLYNTNLSCWMLMKQIYDIHKINKKDKLYYSEQREDNTIYYIFNLGDISTDKDVIVLNTLNCYYFTVPNNKSLKAFLYNIECKDIKIKKTDSLYKLSESEYLNTYLIFMKNDGKYVYELPYKLIQDL